MPLVGQGEALVLNALLTGCFLSLHTGNPGETGIDEVAGAGYTRQPIVMLPVSAPNPTVFKNSVPIQFPEAGVDWGVVTYAGFWNATNDFLGYAPVVVAKFIGSGDVVTWDANTLSVEAD